MTAPTDRVEEGEGVPGWDALGIVAFTTTRDSGSFALASAEPTDVVIRRWESLCQRLRPVADRVAVAPQVHGSDVVVHGVDWRGWLRTEPADAHVAFHRRTALAVTIADCVPVFIAHAGGSVGIVHSGWRGTVADVTGVTLARLAAGGCAVRDLRLHCGPSICGACYEVSPDVYGRLTGLPVSGPTTVDLRLLIADSARRAGVRDISVSSRCTRCDNDRFFSHRAGDHGRQVAVIAAP